MKAIQHVFSTPSSPQSLFEAVATQAGQRAWWCKNCEISEEKGGRHELRFNKAGTPITMHFELSGREAGRRIEWTCVSNDNPAWVGSTLVWEIEAEGEGARLKFVHDGFASGGPPYEGTVQGWPRFIASLKEVVQGRPGNPL